MTRGGRGVKKLEILGDVIYGWSQSPIHGNRPVVISAGGLSASGSDIAEIWDYLQPETTWQKSEFFQK